MVASHANNVEGLTKRRKEVRDRVRVGAGDLLERIESVATEVAGRRRLLVHAEQLVGHLPHRLDKLVQVGGAAMRVGHQSLILGRARGEMQGVSEPIGVGATVDACDHRTRLLLHVLGHVVHRGEQAGRERLGGRVHRRTRRGVHRVDAGREGRESQGHKSRGKLHGARSLDGVKQWRVTRSDKTLCTRHWPVFGDAVPRLSQVASMPSFARV